jgi:amidase
MGLCLGAIKAFQVPLIAFNMTRDRIVANKEDLMKQDYLKQDATGLAALVATGQVSSTELLDTALDLSAALNPSLNAVVVDGAAVARRSIAEGLPEGPFHGVPFLIKDLGMAAVDFPTNNGSKLTPNMRWPVDSAMYERVRETGVVTFGRTASPEFGVGPATEAQVYGGPTRNPWNLDHTPGGSSGGSGAAVAAGIVPSAHGSDGGGSVRIPASSCGLVGFKPTRARLPSGPLSGEGWGGMAIDGFITRSLRDSAAFLDACTGMDLGAPYSAPPMSGTFQQAMQRDAKPLRIRYCTTTLAGEPIHPECQEAVHKTVRLLEGLGHELEELRIPPTLMAEDMMHAWTKIVACGTALSVTKALKGQPLERSKVEGVTWGAVAYARQVSGEDYLDAVNEVHAFGRRMAALLTEFDVLVTATLGEPPAPVGQLKPDNEDFWEYRNGPGGVFEYSPFCAVYNASGQPAVSLPLHWSVDDLPVGVQLGMRFGADEELMTLCAQIEQAAPWYAKQQQLISTLSPVN